MSDGLQILNIHEADVTEKYHLKHKSPLADEIKVFKI